MGSTEPSLVVNLDDVIGLDNMSDIINRGFQQISEAYRAAISNCSLLEQPLPCAEQGVQALPLQLPTATHKPSDEAKPPAALHSRLAPPAQRTSVPLLSH
jgi:hypothetical protein